MYNGSKVFVKEGEKGESVMKGVQTEITRKKVARKISTKGN